MFLFPLFTAFPSAFFYLRNCSLCNCARKLIIKELNIISLSIAIDIKSESQTQLQMPVIYSNQISAMNNTYNKMAHFIGDFCKSAKSNYQQCHVSPSVCPSPCNNTSRIFTKIEISVFFRKSFERIQFPLKYDKNNG